MGKTFLFFGTGRSNPASGIMTDTRCVRLMSKDQQEFKVARTAACMSKFIENMLDETDSSEPIPLLNVDSKTLAKVIQYCEYKKDKQACKLEKPLKSTDLSEAVCDFCAEYIRIDNGEVLEILMAANYLDICPLLELASGQIASQIKNKKPEEIRKEFNIVNDFTPEEEAQVRGENTWCE